ncbi:hypothetical protein GCM10009865_03980 [Aeromicrobium ponti]|uniref:Uncharacterized protein n=1 Tax=Cytobacillus oceanisediminis TaxID=665099 RepID=A0A562K676_9BACI|nr:hypothetical protein IQ19_00306 [Cytobacillus oceanisediminis]
MKDKKYHVGIFILAISMLAINNNVFLDYAQLRIISILITISIVIIAFLGMKQ